MPTVVRPYCSRCGKLLSPAWKTGCKHCGAKYAEHPPEVKTDVVAPGDEPWASPSVRGGGDPGLDALVAVPQVIVGEARRLVRRWRAGRSGIWLSAEVADRQGDGIRVRIDNRRTVPIVVTAIGLTRWRDPAAAYRVPRRDVVSPGRSVEVVLDVAAAVTAAPIKERIFNRDLDHVFVEIEDKRVTDLLAPDVRALLQVRRQRYRHIGRP
jgi:hypothetical protein